MKKMWCYAMRALDKGVEKTLRNAEKELKRDKNGIFAMRNVVLKKFFLISAHLRDSLTVG